MKNVGTIMAYTFMALVLMTILVLPQFAYNSHNGWIAIDSNYSAKLLVCNCAVGIIYLFAILLIHVDCARGDDVAYIYKRRVPIFLYGLTASLLFWSLGWLGYISFQAETRVLVSGWGEYDLAGRRTFWYIVLFAALALCVVTRTIHRDILRGKPWSFKGLLLYQPD